MQKVVFMPATVIEYQPETQAIAVLNLAVNVIESLIEIAVIS